MLTFNAIQGEGTIEPCVCDGDTANDTPIQMINGIRPSSDGKFVLLGSDCLQIEMIENGARLIDVCSAPCCGCLELERITQDLDRFAERAESLERFIDNLRTNVDTMSLVVLGSRLGDRTCTA